MKKRMLLIFVLILLVSASALFSVTVTIREASGKVELKLPGQTSWSPADVGMEIPVETQISTGFRSFAVLDLESSEIRVMPLTRMKIEEILGSSDKVETSLLLNAGRIRADVRTSETRTHDFTITSPIATAAVRGTSFIFNGYSLEVLSGVVLYINSIGEQISVPEGLASETTGVSTPLPPVEVIEESVSVASSTTPVTAGEETAPPLVDAGDTGVPPVGGIAVDFIVE